MKRLTDDATFVCERRYLMYYLNDQGERVYTLKVRATGDGRTDGRTDERGRVDEELERNLRPERRTDDD